MALSAVKGTIERALDKNLQDLVRGIRNHKNDEAKYINDCMEEIKLELKLNSSASKPNAVLKLVYLQMLGYAVGWASFNVVEVMSSSKFIHKRIGYLAASQTFHPKCDVLMLTTNLIRKDLRNSNMYDASIALSGLACFMTQDLAVNLYNDVLTMATSHKPYIRKKSVLLLFKVFLNHPEALRSCFPQLKEKLEDPDPGVQAAAVNVICELARKNPKNYLSLAPIFFKLMTTSTNNWVLIKIIKLFGALTPIEPRLGKKLIEPLTNLILSTSAMSLLYECINTVIAVLISISSAIPNHQDSIQLCVQKLRMLIEDSDQNLKYLGLLALTKIMRYHPNSVQSHKDLILGCLDDKDESIRLRALNLLHGMTTKHNLVEVVKILAKHVRNPSNGSHFRQELVNKIVELCSQDNYQCVTSFEWYVTVLVELARIDTVQAGEMLASQLIEVTIRVPSVRQFCVEQMAILFDLCSSDPNLNARPGALLQTVQAASWICGEYGSNLEDPRHTVKSMLQVAYQLPALSNNVRSITILNAFKIYCSLISRWANNAREDRDDENAKDHLDQRIHHILDTTVFLADQFTLFVHSPDLEVQERAVTLHQLLCLIQKRLEKLRTRLNGPVPPISSPINGQAGDVMSNPSSTVDSERSWTCSVHASLCALAHELDRLFAGEINPVAPKAQRKVPIPEGLDLDSWINTPFDSKDIRDAIRIREPGDSRVSQSRDSNKLSHHPDLFPNLSSPSPKVTLTREQLEEVRLQRLSRVQNDPHYLKPVPSKQVDNPPQSDSPPASNMSVQNGEVKQRPIPVRQFARSEQFVKEIQRNMDAAKVRAKESRPKKSRAKISKDKSSRAMNGLHSTPPDTDPSAPVYNQPDGVSPLVRRNLDMPPGVTIDDISSDEKEDLNDPHRHLNIALDTTMPSASGKKLDPNLVRHSKRTKRKNRQVDAGPSVPSTKPSRMGDDQAVRSPIGFSPTLTPNKPTLMAPSANFSSIPLQFNSKSISVDQFAELVSSGQLSVSLNVKLSIRKDSDMVLILDRLTNQLPCSVVESISSRIVSLYTEQSQNPLCILTKLANQPGFVNVAIRSTDAEAASGCLNRIKSILKQSDER